MKRILSMAMAAVVLMGGAATAVRAGGPALHNDVVAPLSADTYTMTFRGGEQAAVAVVGADGANLVLQVYDSNGNLIDSDAGSQCLVTWTPLRTGKFIIQVVNRDLTAHAYALAGK